MSNKSLNDHIKILRQLLKNLEKANNEVHPLPLFNGGNNGTGAYRLPYGRYIPTRAEMLNKEIKTGLNKNEFNKRRAAIKKMVNNAKEKAKKVRL